LIRKSMATTRVILVRHGETLWNLEDRYQGQLDSPLTETGIVQSKALASRLAREQFTALYTSDLGRALRTAEIIAKQTGHGVATDARLRERHLGIFQGLSQEELQQKFAQEYALFKTSGPEYVVPDGESTDQACGRMLTCLHDLASRHAGDSIVVVAHGGVLTALFRDTLKIPRGAPRRFARPNASWNVFVWNGQKWSLETWGDLSHLQQVKTPP
jgi:probable phosphoglycerate mutase